MDQALRREVRRFAEGRCEYCHLPDSTPPLKHVVDHIIARQHAGPTELENLALCCGRCNQSKGPNIAAIDPQTGALSRLFHPRRDQWHHHFRWQGAILIGTTPVGRATASLLAVNAPLRIAGRRSLLDEGVRFD